MFDWREAQILAELSRLESLGEAAKNLGVDVSTITRRLRSLEKSLETKLFDRSSGRLVPTAEGKGIIELALSMESAAIEIERSKLPDGTSASGRVRIATTRTMAQEIVYPVAESLRRAGSGIVLEVDENVQRIDLIKEQTDIALTCYEISHPRLIRRKVFTATGALYGAVDYLKNRPPLTPETVAGYHILGSGEVNQGTGVDRWFEENVRGGEVVLRSSSVEVLTELCAAGKGISLIFTFRAATYPNLIRLEGFPVFELPHWLVVHPNVKDTERVRVTKKAIMERIEEVRESIEGVMRWDSSTSEKFQTHTKGELRGALTESS